MKQTLKSIGEVAVAAIVLMSVIWIIHEMRKMKKNEENYQSIIREKDAIITYKTNKEGDLIAQKDAAVGSYKQLAEAYPEIAKSIQKDFDIKLKNLKAYMQAEFEARGSGNSQVTNNYYIDSAGNKVEYFKLKASDGFLDFNADVYSPKNAPYTYSYTDSIQYTISTDKKWFLGNERLLASGKLSNPGAKITNTTSYLVESYRDKRFYLGAGMSYGLDGRFVPSIQIGYAFIKF